MRIAFWVILGLLLGSIGLNKYQAGQIKDLQSSAVTIKFQTEKTIQSLKDGFVWDKQQLVNISHDSILTSKTWYAHTLDSLVKANNLNVNRLQSDLNLKSHWIDSTKKVLQGKFVLLNPKDTNKVDPQGKIFVVENQKCWGIKANIVTRDPNSYLEVVERSTNSYTNLIVLKQKRALGFLWITHKAEYHVYNDCGETSITNIQIQ